MLSRRKARQAISCVLVKEQKRRVNLEEEEEGPLFLPFTFHRSEPISQRHGKGEKCLLPTMRVAAGQPLCSHNYSPGKNKQQANSPQTWLLQSTRQQ